MTIDGSDDSSDVLIALNAVSFLLDCDSFVRDDTIIEKFVVAFQDLTAYSLLSIAGKFQQKLQMTEFSFAVLPGSTQRMYLKLLLSILKCNENWPLRIFKKLISSPLQESCKEVFLDLFIFVLDSENSELIQFIEAKKVLIWFKSRNMYLRQKLAHFLSCLRSKHLLIFQDMLNFTETLEDSELNSLVILLDVDLTADSMANIHRRILSQVPLDPRIILKHPEISRDIVMEDYIRQSRSKACFYESLVALFHAGDKSVQLELTNYLCNNISMHQSENNQKFILKAQPVSALVKVLPYLFGNEKEAPNCLKVLLTHIWSTDKIFEPVILRLDILTALPLHIQLTVPEELLIDIMFYSVDENEPKVFEKALKLCLQKHTDDIVDVWNCPKKLLSVEKNVLGVSRSEASLKDCLSHACISTHWDMRDCATNCLAVMMERCACRFTEESKMGSNHNILTDFSNMILILMKDSTVYVLGSVCKLIQITCENEINDCLSETYAEEFFNHCSCFCDDVIHSEMMQLMENCSIMRKYVSKEVFMRTLESDLCSYQTKSLAAKLLCISANDNQTADSQLKTESEKKQLLTSDGKKLVVPDWLEKFLSDSSSDRMLVHHIEVAIGRRTEEVVSEQERKWTSFIHVCEQVMAESQAVHVAMDCY